jgi:hypothetical protein
MPCISERDQGFEGIYSLRFRLAVSFYSFLAWLTLRSWRLRRYISPKRPLPFTGYKTYMAKWCELQFNIPVTVWARRGGQLDVCCSDAWCLREHLQQHFTKGDDWSVYPWQWLNSNKITFEILASLEVNDAWFTWGAIDISSHGTRKLWDRCTKRGEIQEESM